MMRLPCMQTAEQRALKAKRGFGRIRIEAQEKVATAQAGALRRQRQTRSPVLVRLREMEAHMKAFDKWHGHLSPVTGGAVPFIFSGDGKQKLK